MVRVLAVKSDMQLFDENHHSVARVDCVEKCLCLTSGKRNVLVGLLVCIVGVNFGEKYSWKYKLSKNKRTLSPSTVSVFSVLPFFKITSVAPATLRGSYGWAWETNKISKNFNFKNTWQSWHVSPVTSTLQVQFLLPSSTRLLLLEVKRLQYL